MTPLGSFFGGIKISRRVVFACVLIRELVELLYKVNPNPSKDL